MALMGNADDLTKAMDMARESIGSVDEEMEIVMQSYQKKVEVMKNAWASLANTTLSSDLVKGVIDLTTNVLKFTEACGGLSPVLLGVITAFTALKVISMSESLTFKGMISGAKSLISSLVTVKTVTDGATASTVALGVAQKAVIGLGIVGGVMLIAGAYNYFANQAQRAEERVLALKQEISKVSSDTASIESLGAEFEKLSKIPNKTTEETKRLYEVQNQIKDLQPEIGGYYDEQGNFIITQATTARELLETQESILKALKEQSLEESKKVIGSKIEDYEKQRNLLKAIGDEQAKLNRIENGEGSIWDKLTSSSESSKAIMNAGSGVATTFKDTQEKVKEYKDNIKKYTEDIRTYLLDSLTLDDSWSSLGETTANSVRKALSEMSGDDLVRYAQQLRNGDVTTSQFIETLKNLPEVVEEVQKAMNDSEKTSSKLEKQLSSLGVLAEEVANNLDILKVAVAELDASNDISEDTMKKLIKKYPEMAEKIKDVETAYSALNERINQQDFDNATQGMADLTSVLEDLEAGNGITASSFKKISQNFPELLGYMNSEASLADAIKDKMNSLKEVQNNAYRQMLMNSENYYNQNVRGNEQMTNSILSATQSLFNNLGVMYQGDLSNWKSLAQGKAEIEQQLISQLNDAWEKHYGNLRTAFSKLSSGSIIEKATFDREAYAKQNFLSTNPLNKLDKNKIDLAEKAFNAQESLWIEETKKRQQAMTDVSKLFDDIKFDSVDIKIGGAKSSPSSSKSDSKAKASYVASIFKEIVDEILKGGEEIEQAISETQTKLDHAVLVGDTDLEEKLVAKMANLQVQLRDKQASMAKELETQMKEMSGILSKTGVFKNYDMANLSSKDIAEVTQQIEKQINSATLSKNEDEVTRLNNLKSLISDVGGVYVDTIQKRRQLSQQWWEEENTRLEKYVENLKKSYDKKFEQLDKEDKILNIRKSLLLDDSSKYEKEVKESDQILEINDKLFSNIVKRRALCESQLAQLRAKGFSDESKEIQDLIDKWLEYEQSRLDMIKEIAEAKRQAEIDSRQNESSDLSTAKDQINSLLDLTVEMLKKETEAKKDASKEQYDNKKNALKEEYDAEKKALNDKLKLLKEEADARKKALDKEKSDKEYNEKVAEKEKEISKIQGQITELSNDDSASSVKKRKELQAQLNKYIKELEDLQYDRSMQLQKDAIESELEAQEDKINSQLDNLEQQYKDEVELLEDKYKAETKKYEDYLKSNAQLKEEANKLIESKDKAFYERLKNYALEYTNTTKAEFEDCWNKAYDSLDKYGNKQMSVLETIEKMTERIISLNNEIKNLNDNTTYKDFIKDDSTTSSDDYKFAGDTATTNNTSTSSDKKVDEERDKIVRQMNANSNAWFNASADERKRLEAENEKLAKQIGAWKANQDGADYKKGEWVVKINSKLVPVKRAYGVRHTGLETGEVGASWGQFNLKSNEELNKLLKGEIVLNGGQTQKIMDNVKSLANGGASNGANIVIDMHDFSVTKDSLPDFEKLLKERVPKIINDSLYSRGIK